MKKTAKLFILGTLLFIGIACFGCGKTSQLFTRKATINDIYIDLSQEISLNMEYKINPHVDIKELELTFQFYGTNENLITTKTKFVGNVKKDVEYSVTISLFDFSFPDLFKIKSVKAKVSGGSVSYFQ